jgi:hypothetical protein
MFESLFGAEMPLAVRFFVAFLIVLGLIGAIAWVVRRFGSGRLGSGTRGRQPRLAVIDYASVDGRRRLILVRRDNVEHLLMIGGPSDIVVEPNIVRAVPAQRDVGRAPPGIESLTRAIPLPEPSASWPQQPEANGGVRPSVRAESQHEELPGRPQIEPASRQRDTLAALADELSTRPTPPSRGRSTAGEPPRQDTRQDPRQDQRQNQRQELRAELRPEAREPRPDSRLDPRKPLPTAATAAPASPAAPPTTTAAESPATADQSLADMAQRLEAALRKSPAEPRMPGAQARPGAQPEPAARSESLPLPPPRPVRTADRRPEQAQAPKPNQNKGAIYDTLEQEMANLLGRPSKT